MRCLAAGLRNYDLAEAARCFWFSEGFREGNKVEFPDLLKKKTCRRMVGKSKLLARVVIALRFEIEFPYPAMTTAELISIFSLTVFSLSLTLAIWNYTYNLRYTRVSLTERLHELWWSKDMMETREEVYALCKQAASNPSEMSALAVYYREPLVTPDPPGRAAFAKLVGFFCNIEVCLDSKVIDERITCDLFAEAHYADYQPLIAAVREAILEPSRKTGRLPKWLSMTVQLERRFARRGINFPVPHQQEPMQK